MPHADRPRISACILARNEAAFLPGCLASLAGQVDAIVVLDTGSTDETIAIAHAAGARVLPFAWQDDFSAARNALLDALETPWALFLDADERLETDPPDWRDALAAEPIDAYRVPLAHVGADGQITSRLTALRLLRKQPGLRYEGRIEEHPVWPAGARAIADLPTLAIHHLGGTPAERARRGIPERFLSLGAAWREDAPAEPRAWAAWAEGLNQSDRIDEARDAYQEARVLHEAGAPLPAGVAMRVYQRLIDLHEAKRDPLAANETLTAALDRFPDFAPLRFKRALRRFAAREWDGARADLLACLEAPLAPAPTLSLLSGYRVRLRLAAIAIERGELAEAATHAEAMGLAPDAPAAQQARHQEYAELLARLARAERTLDTPGGLSTRSAGTVEAATIGTGLAQPTVSACLIVKNESEMIDGCLASLKGFVDEIVVVDTGSTDDTLARLEAAGARVFQAEWHDDFSEARNLGLERAVGDWILVIDADERLEVTDVDAWRQALRRGGVGGYLIDQISPLSDGRVDTHPITRLFRRHPAIRYEDTLHETVDQSIGELGLPRERIEAARLAHEGSREAIVVSRDKPARNLRAARRGAEKTPDRPRAWWLVGDAAREASESALAIEAYERALALGEQAGRMPYFVDLAIFRGYVSLLVGEGRLAEAEGLLDRALRRYPWSAELRAERGALRAGQRDAEGAWLDAQLATGCRRVIGRMLAIAPEALYDLGRFESLLETGGLLGARLC